MLDCLSCVDERDPALLTAAMVRITERLQTPAKANATLYHLGNRHIALEIGAGWVRYRVDPVLDGMVATLGLRTVREDQPFEPEAGATTTGSPWSPTTFTPRKTTVKPSTGNEGRKQVKIINPGNTVILEFGPDRRH